jgi:CubicO group peptidase (beta-lactamase class C family)
VVLLRAVLTASTLVGPQGRDSAPPRTIAGLESRIRMVLVRTRVPAAAVAVVTRDSDLWVAGLGTADVASGRRATAETLFRIGSTSKAFVALLVLRLEEQGRLRLDDPVRTYAPEIGFRNRWEATDPVRIVNLLEHTTGWDDLAPRDYANSDSTPLTLRQGLDFNPGTRTSRWRPGTRVAYCNSGPAVAAYIVQKLEGQPFETLVHDRLFGPIGMTTATYFPPMPRDRLATLYHGDGQTPFPYWYLSERPAGAINASARDMAAYVRFLLNRGQAHGRQVVPRAAVERMEHPESSLGARAGLALGYGLGLGTYVADTGVIWVGHDGSVPGGLTMMAYRPDQGVGFAFMINADNYGALRQIDHLLRTYLIRSLPHPALPPVAPMAPHAREWAGWYVFDNPRLEHLYFLERLLALVRVQVSARDLTLKPLLSKGRRFLPVTATLFRPADGPVATLALEDDAADGRPAAIERMGYLLPVSYHRIATPIAWLQVGGVLLFLAASAATILFAIVWVPRALFGGLRRAPHLSVRGWPLVATLTFLLTGILTAVSGEDSIDRYGAPTAWAWEVTLGTVLFAGAAILGCLALTRARETELRRGVRVYAVVANLMNLVGAAYLARWGMIGWRSWGGETLFAPDQVVVGRPATRKRAPLSGVEVATDGAANVVPTGSQSSTIAASRPGGR